MPTDALAAAAAQSRDGHDRQALETVRAALAAADPGAGQALRLRTAAAEYLVRLGRYGEAAGNVLAACAGAHDGETVEDVARARLVLAHALHLAGDGAAADRWIAAVLASAPPDSVLAGEAHRVRAERHLAEARYDAARADFETAIAVLSAAAGPDHPLTARAVNGRGGLALATSANAEAQTWLQDAYERRQRCFRAPHPDLAESLHNLGGALLRQGRYAEAVAHEEAAVAMWRATAGPEHPAIATALGNLGTIAMRRGDLGRAEALYREVLRLRERTLGADHPRVAVALNNLATLLMRGDRLDEARGLLERSLRIAELVHGPEHPDVARALTNLAAVASRLGDRHAAVGGWRRAAEIWERTQGPRSPELATTLCNIAAALVHEPEGGDEAEDLLLRGLAIQSQTLGPDHVKLAPSLATLGALLLHRGEDERALELLRRAERLHLAAGEGSGPHLVPLLVNLATAELRAGTPERAHADARRALEIGERALGAESSRLIGPLVVLAGAAEALGLDEELEARERLVALHRRHDDPGSPNLAWSLLLLGTLRLRRGEPAAAAPHLDEALSLWRGLDEPDRATVRSMISTLLLLGLVAEKGGRDELARDRYSEALDLAERMEERAARPRILIQLAGVEARLGAPEAARRHLEEAVRQVAHSDDLSALALLRLRRLYGDGEAEAQAATLAQLLEVQERRHGLPGGPSPDHLTVLRRQLADLYAGLGRGAEALDLYHRVLVDARRSPDLATLAVVTAIRLSQLALLAGRHELAVEAATAMLELLPTLGLAIDREIVLLERSVEAWRLLGADDLAGLAARALEERRARRGEPPT